MPITAFSLAIFYVSSLPGDVLPKFAWSWEDKVLHAIAYFVYGIACLIAVAGWRPWWSLRQLRRTALGIGTAWGSLDEVHQMFTVHRDASLLDLGADVLGLGLALLLARLIRGIFR
jgi:VanZ family protein